MEKNYDELEKKILDAIDTVKEVSFMAMSCGKYSDDIVKALKSLNSCLEDVREAKDGREIVRTMANGMSKKYKNMSAVLYDMDYRVTAKRVRLAIKNGTHYAQCLWSYC